jgi:hypothetical protein
MKILDAEIMLGQETHQHHHHIDSPANEVSEENIL